MKWLDKKISHLKLNLLNKYMIKRSSISHKQKDKDYILELMDKAKLKGKIPLNTSFSSLLFDCTKEYLEHILDKK